MSATRPPAFDDRVTTSIEASRRGAHRARSKPASTVLPVLAGIAVILLVGAGVYTLLGRGPSGVASNSTVTSAATPSSPKTSSSGAANSAPTTPPAATTPAAAATSGSATVVDRGINLVVLNSVSVQGLAKRVQTSIQQDGWKVQKTANSNTRNLSTTKIYYGKSSTKASADALKKDLGFGVVVQDSGVVQGSGTAGSGLVVVLGKDAE